MQVRPIDPRDVRWEVPNPGFRVYFWEQQDPQDPRSGWVSSECQIEDADVDQVLNWARDSAGGRRFVVYVQVIGGQHGELGLVRLLGTDPLDAS